MGCRAPPADWKAQVDRWERFNTLRTVAVVAAFVLLLTALTPTPIKG
jgi:uncharacterized membrane protein